jgi:hypothetical protein
MQVLPSCGAAERGASVLHTVGPVAERGAGATGAGDFLNGC